MCSTKFAGSRSCNSTNRPATIWLTSFAGTGEKPGPTTKGWCKIGVWASEERPPTLGEAVTAAVLVDSVTAVIGEANVVTKAGTTKSGLPWTVAAETAGETDEKPTPEAAKLEAWAPSWPVEDEDEHEPGTPPSEATIGTLEAKLVAGVEGRFEVYSAASTCLTALTTAARKAGEGWSDIGDCDAADGSAEPVLGKLEFTAELDGLLSTGEIMASKAAAWLLRVGLDVIS